VLGHVGSGMRDQKGLSVVKLDYIVKFGFVLGYEPG
jgi:hypothetical protein